MPMYPNLVKAPPPANDRSSCFRSPALNPEHLKCLE